MNYVLPEGFDFYGELNNHSDNDNLNLNEHSYDNKCLISGIELDTNKSITLNCGHSFDYIALLNDTQESKYGKSCKNNYNSMKIPITINGYDCTDDRGCKELNDGDTVTISSYNGVFKCKIYKDEKYKYIPYL